MLGFFILKSNKNCFRCNCTATNCWQIVPKLSAPML